MKKLLTDIELDFYELKCLLEYLDKNPQDQNIYKVTRRSLKNLTSRMSELESGFDQKYSAEPIVAVDRVAPTQPQEVLVAAPIIETVLSSQIQEPVVATKKVEELIPNVKSIAETGDHEPAKEEVNEISSTGFEPGTMFRALSLNDVFRFSRELFGGDTNKFKKVVTEMECLGSYEQAVGHLATQVTCKTDDLAFLDMDDFLQRYFKY